MMVFFCNEECWEKCMSTSKQLLFELRPHGVLGWINICIHRYIHTYLIIWVTAKCPLHIFRIMYSLSVGAFVCIHMLWYASVCFSMQASAFVALTHAPVCISMTLLCIRKETQQHSPQDTYARNTAHVRYLRYVLYV